MYNLDPLARQQEIRFGPSLGGLLPMPFAGLRGDSFAPQQSLLISACQDDSGATCDGEHAPGILIDHGTASVARPMPTAARPMPIQLVRRALDEVSDWLNQLISSAGQPHPATVPHPSQSPTRCAVLGRRAKGPQYSLLDENDPERGLQLRFDKGSECRPGQRYTLILMLECNLAAQGLGSQIPARVQRRSACEFVVRVETAVGCPINVGEK